MTCYLGIRAFCTCHTRRYSGIELQFALNWRIGEFCLCLICCISHFFDIGTFARAKGRIAEERYLRVYTKDFCTFNCLTTDLNKLILSRIDIDRTVAHGKHFILTSSTRTDKDKAGRYDTVARLRLNNLKSRTNSVRGRVCRAAKEGVCNTHLNKHCAKVIRLGKNLLSLLRRHTFAFTKFAESLNHLVKAIVIITIYNLCTANIITRFLRSHQYILLIANKNRVKETACQKAGGSLKNTWVCSLGKDNRLRAFFQLINHCTKSIHHINPSFSF